MRRLLSLDTETHLIAPGIIAPPLVCGSSADFAGGVESARILSPQQTIDTARAYFTDPAIITSGANIAYDMGVLAAADPTLLDAIFQAYAEGRIYDVQIAQALDAIAGGHLFKAASGGPLLDATGKQSKRYSLAICVSLNCGRADAKINDFWRLRFAILERVPMSAWPDLAIQYTKDDAWNTVEVAAVQMGLTGREPLRNIEGQSEQAETAFALQLGAVWGLRTSPARVQALRERVQALATAHNLRFAEVGFIQPATLTVGGVEVVNPDAGKEIGSAIKRAVAQAYGATGVCERCKGSGKVRNVKQVPCRGVKVGNRYQGCLWCVAGGAPCVPCNETGFVDVLGNEIICKGAAGGCDGTGLDLNTAPTLPRTDGNGVSAGRDTLVESGDDTLHDFGENEHAKILETYIPFLEQGTTQPLCLRPNVLVESMRTSYDGVIQQIPRGGGVRECFTARDGRVFGSTDYAAVELCTLAQVCLWVVGSSVMADTINASQKPGSLHTAFAAQMIGVEPDELQRRIDAKDPQAKGYRQAAKAANFGFPGGMGAARLVLSKRKRSEGETTAPNGRKYSGIRFCILIGGAHECGTEKITTWKKRDYPPICKACVEVVEHQLKPAYFSAWPEMHDYFAWVKGAVEENSEIPCLVPSEFPQLIRGGVDFCNGANNGFQHLAARGGKAALRAVTREAYTDRDSPLFKGAVRVPMFVHDELFTEGIEVTAHLWGPRVAEVMIREMRRYVPDVCIEAETALMRFWSKDAEPVYNAKGKLIVWEPKH